MIRILWVEDEPFYVCELARILEEEIPATVDCASTAYDALQKMAGTKYDLIILDSMFPVGPVKEEHWKSVPMARSGVTLLTEVRSDTRDLSTVASVPAVMVSATGNSFDLQEMRDLGARVVEKPVWCDELVSVIQDMVLFGGKRDGAPGS